MIITRLYTAEDNESYFEEINIMLIESGEIGRLSETQSASGVVFRETDGNYDYDFHNAPQRQYILLLDGEIEIETSLGDVKRFKGGDVILAEDTTGRGHKSKSIDGKPRRSVFIVLE